MVFICVVATPLEQAASLEIELDRNCHLIVLPAQLQPLHGYITVNNSRVKKSEPKPTSSKRWIR